MATAVAGRDPRGPHGRQGGDGFAVITLSVIGAVVVFTLLGGSLVFDSASREAIGPDLIVWAILATLGGMATIDFGPGRPHLSMDLPVLLACSFVAGPVPAGVVALLGTYYQSELRGRVPIPRLLWNHSQTALSVIAGGFAFQSLGGLDSGLVLAILAALAGLSADALVNYTCVAFLVYAASGDSFLSVVSSMRVGSPMTFVPVYVSFGLMSLVMAVTFESAGFAGVVLFVAPMVLAREAFSQRLHAEIERQQGRAQRQALSRVDERIADERRDERSRIAAALHDDVLQCLYNVSIRAQVIGQDFRTGRLLDLEDDVPSLIEASERAADELRNVIQGLRRSSIGHAGLVDTLTLLARHLRDETGINFILSAEDSPSAAAEVELLAYQIVREAMTNCARHSEADTVWVSLSRLDDWLRFEVLDNGKGFDADRNQQSRHFGLPLMKERAESAGGTIEIKSSRGGGTRVTGQVPLSARRASGA